MPTTTPYAPNLPRRPRAGSIRGFSNGSSQDMNDPRAAAIGLYNAGIQLGPNGQANPTRDFGALMQGYSQQFNPLSRGAKPGMGSGLGTPMNSMYANNPGFFQRSPAGQTGSLGGSDFGSMIAQRNQTMASGGGISQPTIGQNNVAADPFFKPASPTAPAPTDQSAANRDYWGQQAWGRKVLDQASGNTPTVSTPSISYPDGSSVPQMGARNIEGKYGQGFATFGARKPGQEGLINGRPASEVLQGLANKPGVARPGDKYQPKTWTAEEISKLKRR